MKLTNWVDRKLVLMIVGPVVRTAFTGLTGYLTAKGVPAEMVGQFGEAVAVSAAVGFNILWDLVSKVKAENKGAREVAASYAGFYDDVRARFDRESV